MRWSIVDGIGDAGDNDIMADNEEEDNEATKTKVIVNKRKRRSYQERATKNILQDVSYIPDAERDELHVEIYKYLSWLHSKLADLSETACAAIMLEEALSSALKELVLSREVAGKPKRRSRKRTVKKINNPRRMHDKTAKDWDTMFGELVEYKEEHGDCLVSKNHTDNEPVSN